MKKSNIYLIVALFATILFSTQKGMAQYTIPAKMNWWYESRFGMFIHFGSYSYLAQGEWAMSGNYTKTTYQTQVSAMFNPSKFNAGTIARLAKRAGMKYLVITAKHHEGFCMWPTAVKSFKSIDTTKLYDLREYTSFDKTRDVLKELKDSCDAVGVKFCLYYSILDWNHPSQEISRGNNTNGWYTFSTLTSATAKAKYITDMKAQLKELIDNYHPALLWFDGDWTYQYGDYIYGTTAADKWWTKADGVDLQNYLRALDPNLIMNERVFRSAGLGDWDCSEGSILATANSRPWETCQTMNNSWGYNSGDNKYKTTKALILELVQNVSRDGNYLLNIGPKGDGTVPDESIVRLDSIGNWMDINKSSIYGATRSPYTSEPAWGLYTTKTGKLYAHVFLWPTNGLLKVPSLQSTNTIKKIYLLNDTTTLLNYKDSLGYIWISVPSKAPNSISSVVTIEVAGLPKASTQYTKVTQISVTGQGGLTAIQGDMPTLQMSAAITPGNATDKTVSWAVSDTSIASISNTGFVTAKKSGSVTVTATAKDGSDIIGQIKITITKYTKVTGISVSGQGGLTSVTGVGGTLQMLAAITPTNATDKTVTWTVSDTSMASISNTGLVTAKKIGSLTVTATAKDGSGVFGKTSVTVNTVPPQLIKVSGISVSGQDGLTSVTGVGGTLQMSAAITPTNATDKTVTWAVSDTSLASISNTGLVTAKKAGSLTVTATAKDGSDIFGKTLITVSIVSAISNPRSSSLKIYPNPVKNGMVNLRYDNSSKLIHYSLVDTLGKDELKGTFTHQTTLDLRNYKPGIYLIRVEIDGKTEVQKLVVNR
jgi:alpha-L-fucosidase